MKYFIVYLSAATKIEVETYTHVVNAEARQKELFDRQMIPARLIAGHDLSTATALAEYKASITIVDAGQDVDVEAKLLSLSSKSGNQADVDVELEVTEVETPVVMNQTTSGGSSYLNDAPSYADGHDSDLHSDGNEVDEELEATLQGDLTPEEIAADEVETALDISENDETEEVVKE